MSRYVILKNNEIINVVDYESPPGNPPPGFEGGHIAVQHDQASFGWTYKNGVFTSPDEIVSDEELKERCKQHAKGLLYLTDWVENPSVTDTNNTPHLTNLSEFLEYRKQIRVLVITPVVKPTFPEKPIATWE
jgi:hypothetical protein